MQSRPILVMQVRLVEEAEQRHKINSKNICKITQKNK